MPKQISDDNDDVEEGDSPTYVSPAEEGIHEVANSMPPHMKAKTKGCELFDAHREFLMEKWGGKRERGSKTREPAVRQDPEWRQSLQASMSIPKKAFDRLINDTFKDLQKTMDDEMEDASKIGCDSGDGDIKISKDARIWAQAACEEFVSSVFSDCTVLRKHAKRSKTVYRADMRLLMGIRSGRLFERKAEDAELAFRRDLKGGKEESKKRAVPDPEAGFGNPHATLTLVVCYIRNARNRKLGA